MIEIREYITAEKESPFARWFDGLDTRAALKVNTCITRPGGGNVSSLKGVGNGVYECRIDCGPGYRVYIGKDGKKLIILPGGGIKKRQQSDIERAKMLWQEYKKQKKR